MTPMEQQYFSIKRNHQDKILLFRLGDFYELFQEDAEIASQILNIAMTKRHGRPMCGFPFHALDQYAYKLVEAGHKVAICEQTEESSQTKGIVKREVVSILTQGTWSENPLLDQSVNSFLSVISFEQGILSLIFVDIATGELILRTFEGENPISFLKDEISRYMPVEIICPQKFLELFSIEEELKAKQKSLRIMSELFYKINPLFNKYKSLHGSFFENLHPSIEKAFIGLFSYLIENHFSEEQVNHLRVPLKYYQTDTLFMNKDTLMHLELTVNNKDLSNKGTLFSVLNKCKTTAGSRRLRRLLVAPSAILDVIRKMQSRTAYFIQFESSNNGISDLLKGASDLDRLSARLITGKILPRELLALADTVQRAEKLKDILRTAEPFIDYLAGIQNLKDLCMQINETINPDCSNSIDGQVFLPGTNNELDELKELLSNAKNFLITLQTEEKLKTGISSLKIGYNKIYGYYIEVGKASSKNIPPHYKRKQSLINTERYTIPELENFENKIFNAEESVLKLERHLYQNLVLKLQEFYSKLLPVAEFIAEIDLRLALATVAKQKYYTAPLLTEDFLWNIIDGRHPVIESLLKTEPFVANNTHLEKNNSHILIVTGPNMAGKSTYLRQNALFAVMAQIGSYIPASSAQLGIVDKIFTRIGASDDLGSGRSTFFMEMQEAAEIVAQTTSKSLVIMDELGRGTSTSDGLAIAWAVLEYFLSTPDKKAKIFFSTHYHELTKLEKNKGIKTLCMAVQEHNNKPIFLRKVIEGHASKSYGIHVAEMAGLNQAIVTRAYNILNALEKGTFFNPEENELPNLFTSPSPKNSKLYDFIENINPNKLTPLEALQLIFEIKELL